MVKRTRGKGFKRTPKQWEETVATHLGKLADRLTPSMIAELMAIAGTGYLGYKATEDWKGALIGVLGYKLATGPGGTPPVSQVAGLAILGGLGLVTLGDAVGIDQPWMPQDWFFGALGAGWELGRDIFGEPENGIPTVESSPSSVGYEETGYSGGGQFGPGSLYAYRQAVREAVGMPAYP